MALAPLPLLFPAAGVGPSDWRLLAASLSAGACLLSALTLLRKPALAKLFGTIAATGCYASAWPYISGDPFIALTATVALISSITALADIGVSLPRDRKGELASRSGQRARWAVSIAALAIVGAILTDNPKPVLALLALGASVLIAFMLYVHWLFETRSEKRILLALTGLALIVVSYLLDGFALAPSLAALCALAALLSFPRQKKSFEMKTHWREILLDRPARILLTSFAGLCALGTFALLIPTSTQSGSIDLIDAVFTSVSAVCVTGLIVLDTQKDFAPLGQFFILALIQSGGLGIMTITTVALSAMGRRLSLKREQTLTSMTDTEHKDLIGSLKTILKFTFGAEGIGAALLFFLFLDAGDSAGMALWRALFTSVSAFCNAGFALQSDSLIPYQTNALILHTVAALIILGGIAPASALLARKWISGKPIPIPARIALTTTLILLTSGAAFALAFEWNGIFSGLSVADKIHNAWFQSVTLRTAGFNSVDIAASASPTFFIMVAFMFIGGSPGGVAGGVKTTTIGILAMTFWANITNQNDIVAQNRRIHPSTIYRAITIVVSGMIVCFIVVLMLEVTQQIDAKNLFFEAVSAIGTVGLSIGATPLLDEIGKAIIIIAMFAGRVGPITLFMLLSARQSNSATRYPEERISLT